MKINRDVLDVWHDDDLDLDSRTFFLYGDVDAAFMIRATKALHLLAQEEEPITILLNTGGGDEACGMGVYDLIKAFPSHVTIRVIGEALSMGAVILQAADLRQAMPHAVIMHHSGTTSVPDDHKTNAKAYMDFYTQYDDHIDQIMLDRINEKRTEDGERLWTVKDWRKEDTWDRWMLPQVAIEKGLLDEIYTNDK